MTESPKIMTAGGRLLKAPTLRYIMELEARLSAAPLEGQGDQGSSLRDTQPGAEGAVLVKHMTERFLCWRLPETFNPDNGVSFRPPEDGPNRLAHWPMGTNVFDYDQAKAMVLHMLEGADL